MKTSLLLILCLAVPTLLLAPYYPNYKEISAINLLKKLSQRYDISLNLIHAIWEQESNKAIVSKHGKAGEYGPFQILEIAAKQVNCEGSWRSTFSKNAECGIKYLELGSKKCGNFYKHKIATFYNTGSCRKKPNGYSQQVMKRMLKI